MQTTPSNEFSAVRTQLIARFEKIRTKNPAYSVRAYARDLKIHVSTLSRILSGKRRLTERQTSKLLSRLDLGGSDGTIPTEPTYRNLTLEEHLLTARWYTAAIQELTHTKGFVSDAAWIAKRLGVEAREIQTVIEKLLEIGFLKKNDRGVLIDNVENWYTDLYDHHEAAKRANSLKHRELSERSVAAYESRPENEVSFTRVTFSGDVEQMEKAKKLIARLRRDINALFQTNTRDRSEVFLLQVNLFPLTASLDEVNEEEKSRTRKKSA